MKKVHTSVLLQKAKARDTFKPDLSHSSLFGVPHDVSAGLQAIPAGLELGSFVLPLIITITN